MSANKATSTKMESEKESFYTWCTNLQEIICEKLETLEYRFSKAPHTFSTKNWERPGGGGGRMALLEGELFEKAGVNVSCVHGTFKETFRSKIPGCDKKGRFWASGLSLVIHPKPPHVPIIHMNVRHIKTQKQWFGGGIDLTPVFPTQSDTLFFHTELQKICDTFDTGYYPRFKQWADTYFWLPHRKEARGVGGIFYDNLDVPFDTGFAFTKAIGESFTQIYAHLVEHNWKKAYAEKERAAQLKKRGRYAEFNLLYDRGTRFGLETDGNIDAILMSLPPLAAWPSPLNNTQN